MFGAFLLIPRPASFASHPKPRGKNFIPPGYPIYKRARHQEQPAQRLFGSASTRSTLYLPAAKAGGGEDAAPIGANPKHRDIPASLYPQ
ncbi:hypothetical protein CHU92_08330 [Flavobacterium cyanobacteriorum]|uniref:Uncharacterized protein n=1 Tax=Flavobacterium cyanobacteriorum TaxID=2022802 RepID=A0A255Z991_9FLAO|nr:hypothetical protein CHU92_08330 [Flavobacterium cyanobacteriorum]